jgi:uncharacterized protein YbdZ (MbtH family)
MTYQNLIKFNRGISTLIGILIVLAFAILVGGMAIWQGRQSRLFLETLIKQAKKEIEICEIGKEYRSTAVSLVSCKCPKGYEFKVISMGWGPCPKPGMQDCPASILKCVKKQELKKNVIFIQNKEVSISCNSDEDCILVNKEINYRSCWPGSCEIVDYSLEKYVAVNKNSFEEFRKSEAKFRPSAKECGPAPLCPVFFKKINRIFKAKCVDHICKKTPIVEKVNNFIACKKAGYLILDSYPPQCKTPDGRIFTEHLIKIQNKDVSISCDSDEDCRLVNKELDYSICWPSYCKTTIDPSLDKYVAVNIKKFRESQLKNKECGEPPKCVTILKNIFVHSECIDNICKKVLK